MSKFDVKRVGIGPKTSIPAVIVSTLLGAVAVGAGVYAELYKKNVPTDKEVGTLGHVMQCAYQKEMVHLIALGGALCLSVSQVLLATLGGCVCCCTLLYARGRSHNYSMVLFLLSWLFFFPSQICLLSGAYVNEYHSSLTYFQYDYNLEQCFKTRGHLYYVGSITASLSTLFLLLYYGQAQKSKYEAWLEYGAPTPRLYNATNTQSFVIAGPGKKMPLSELEEQRRMLLNKDGEDSAPVADSNPNGLKGPSWLEADD